MPGGFVDIVYRASIFDDPVRPILRFRTSDGAQIDRFLPGPVAGAGIWVGRVPRGTIEIWISPTRHRGRFDFVIEEPAAAMGLAFGGRRYAGRPLCPLGAFLRGARFSSPSTT